MEISIGMCSIEIHGMLNRNVPNRDIVDIIRSMAITPDDHTRTTSRQTIECSDFWYHCETIAADDRRNLRSPSIEPEIFALWSITRPAIVCSFSLPLICACSRFLMNKALFVWPDLLTHAQINFRTLCEPWSEFKFQASHCSDCPWSATRTSLWWSPWLIVCWWHFADCSLPRWSRPEIVLVLAEIQKYQESRT